MVVIGSRLIQMKVRYLSMSVMSLHRTIPKAVITVSPNILQCFLAMWYLGMTTLDIRCSDSVEFKVSFISSSAPYNSVVISNKSCRIALIGEFEL